MKMRAATGFVLFVGSCFLVSTQVATHAQLQVGDIVHMSGGFSFHTTSVTITGQGADVNRETGQADFTGPVKVSPAYRPLTVEVPATNAAGVPFPATPPIVMHFTGNFQITIDRLTIRADEADVNGRTGEMELRGNVTLIPLDKPKG